MSSVYDKVFMKVEKRWVRKLETKKMSINLCLISVEKLLDKNNIKYFVNIFLASNSFI